MVATGASQSAETRYITLNTESEYKFDLRISCEEKKIYLLKRKEKENNITSLAI
jgi:hypothetical protein